jgi:hypothetical protein
MIRSASRAFFLALPLAVLVAGCGSPTAPTVTTTTTTTTTATTVTDAIDPYTGSIVAGGRNTIPATGFDSQPGLITVKMTGLDPNVIVPAIGMGLGTFDVASSTCTLVALTTATVVNTVVIGTASVASSATTKFCVQVWDVNGFAPGYVQGFTLTVEHQKLITP